VIKCAVRRFVNDALARIGGQQVAMASVWILKENATLIVWYYYTYIGWQGWQKWLWVYLLCKRTTLICIA
jgi:hypothetical protein